MPATLPINRIGAHFDAPPKAPIPKSPRARGQLWSDAIFEAVMALKNQLNSLSESVVATAATALLDLERTRMRHGQDLCGSDTSADEEEFRGALDDEDDPEFEEVRQEQEAATDEHAEEVRKFYKAERGHTMTPAEADSRVRDCLQRWMLPARTIPKGDFVALMKEMGEFDG